MPKELKKILTYAVIGIAVIWIGGCIIRREGPVYAKWKLKRQIGGLETWTASTNYSADGWKGLFAAAKAFQKAEPALAGEAIADHFGSYANKPELLAVEQGKVFLLLRVVFDLPEHAEAGRKFSFADWTRARTDENPDGTVNLAWPMSFASGSPRLVAGREGNAGSYSPRNEYTFLRYQFQMRDLSHVQPGQ